MTETHTTYKQSVSLTPMVLLQCQCYHINIPITKSYQNYFDISNNFYFKIQSFKCQSEMTRVSYYTITLRMKKSRRTGLELKYCVRSSHSPFIQNMEEYFFVLNTSTLCPFATFIYFAYEDSLPVQIFTFFVHANVNLN